jgi:molecular chaperone GrpE
MKDDKKKVENIEEEVSTNEEAVVSEEVNPLEAQLIEAQQKYLRALADYQNLERQMQVWKEEFTKYANQGLIRKLLEVLDDLEKAQEHIKDDGLAIIVSKLRAILAEEGVIEIEILEKDYDANVAEAVGTEKGEEEHKVVRVLQKGYSLKDRVIRPAKVIVSTKD